MGRLPQSLSLSTVNLDIFYRILFLVSVCAAQGKSISVLLCALWGAYVHYRVPLSQ